MSERFTQIQAVVFDLDDTLYPEIEYVHSGFTVVARELARRCDLDAEDLTKQFRKEFQNGDRTRVFDKVLEYIDLPPDAEMIAELLAVYREHTPEIRIAKPVRDLLVRLKSNYKLGLLTDGYLPAQKLKVQALDIGPLFDHIIYTEALGRGNWKPSPLGFEKMADTLGFSHKNCCYIADNPVKDFIAPNRLGWLTIQVRCPDGIYHPDPPDPAAAAQVQCNKLLEIGDLLL